MNRNLKGAILTMFGGACWGMSGSMGQYLFSVQGMDSKWLVPIRLGVAGILMLMYSAFRYKDQILAPWKEKKTAISLILYGVPGVACSQFFYFLCIQKSSAGIGTIMQDLAPLLIILVSCIMTRKLPKLYVIISVIFALAGVYMLTMHGTSGKMEVSGFALFCGFLSAVCITLYNMLAPKLTSRFPVVVLQGWSFLLGGLFIGVIFQSWKISYTPNLMGYVGIAFVILVGNVLAFTTYITGVHLIGPAKGCLYEFTEPVTAAIITTLMLGSKFTIYDAIGFVLIFFMLMFISFGPRWFRANED